jgi:hypothetical protein
MIISAPQSIATSRVRSAGTTARVGIKPDGDYDAPCLAVTTLTQTGTGTATVYSGELNLHTTAMATAFAHWCNAEDHPFPEPSSFLERQPSANPQLMPNLS